jgi:hypothetical protein
VSVILAAGATLAVLVGAAHSYLGERYILTRLFRRADLPHLFGGDAFTKRTLRFAWHLSTVAWWGFAAMLLLLAPGVPTRSHLGAAIAGTFLITAVITFAVSRGRHFAWPVFLAIAIAAWWGTR